MYMYAIMLVGIIFTYVFSCLRVYAYARMYADRHLNICIFLHSNYSLKSLSLTYMAYE